MKIQYSADGILTLNDRNISIINRIMFHTQNNTFLVLFAQCCWNTSKILCLLKNTHEYS